jgi:NAD(P)H-nitrite reductase large subunit
MSGLIGRSFFLPTFVIYNDFKLKKTTMDREETICNCMQITRGEIIDSINNGSNTIEAVGEDTEAGTACEACHDDIQEILDEMKA